mmetsp:Transcript_12963/g.33177  ORF Transcript_12963/g.33177 Transcript_12963/m.33177 type:complete len:175 (+) Transcript_12963:219-743(+)
MLRVAPRLAGALEAELYWDRKGEVPPGKLPFYKGPVFNHHDGRVLTIYDRRFFDTASRHDKVPPLDTEVKAALDLFEATAADEAFRFDMELAPGDLQLVHNHTVVHARNGFVDSAAHRRHLLRLWLSLDDGVGWALPPAYSEGRYANIDRSSGQPVGGIVAADGAGPTVPLHPV